MSAAAVLAGGLMALVAGVVGAVVNHNFTIEREDRARQAQQKRETVASALAAWRDFVVADEDSSERAEGYRLAGANMNSASDNERAYARDLEAAIKQGSDAGEIEREIARLKPHWAGSIRRAEDISNRLDEALARRRAAAHAIEYWGHMLDLTCSSDTAAIYWELPATAGDEARFEKKEAFARAARQEIERDLEAGGLRWPWQRRT